MTLRDWFIYIISPILVGLLLGCIIVALLWTYNPQLKLAICS